MEMISNIKPRKTVLACILQCFFVLLLAQSYYGISLAETDITVNFSGKETPIKEVVTELSRQTGYTIALDKQLDELSVSGQYEDVTVDEFFQRILRGYNISIVHDDQNAMYIVHLFGAKDAEYSVYGSLQQEGGNPKAVHGQQKEMFLSLSRDPNHIGIGGVSNSERWAAHSAQNETYEQLKTNPLANSSGLGKGTNAERWDLHKNQQEKFISVKNDPNFVDMGGVSNAQRSQQHAAQYKSFQSGNLEGPGSERSLSGVVSSETASMHRQQYEQFKKESKEWLE